MAPRPMFKCKPVDESFFDTAPFRISETFAVAKPAAEVWADLTAEKPLGWCRLVDDVTWTSPRPFGVGTTRTVKALKGVNVIDEEYFIWEEGRRQAFYALQASGPLFKRFAEDYVVEPSSDSSCWFTWTIAGEFRAPRLTTPGNKLLLGTLLKDTRKHYGSP